MFVVEIHCRRQALPSIKVGMNKSCSMYNQQFWARKKIHYTLNHVIELSPLEGSLAFFEVLLLLAVDCFVFIIINCVVRAWDVYVFRLPTDGVKNLATE